MILILVVFLDCIWCVGQLRTGLRIDGGTLIEYYMHVNALSDSWKYLTRERDRQYIARMQRVNAMVERINVDPPSNLKIINDVGMKTLNYSQTIHEHWYAVNLNTKCCECEVRVCICKHLFARKLMDKEYTYLKGMMQFLRALISWAKWFISCPHGLKNCSMI